jgi:hypothetical protein
MEQSQIVEEGNFLEWYNAWRSKFPEMSPDPYNEKNNYNFREAYNENFYPNKSGVWPGKFRRPGHPLFSLDSIYYKAGMPVGTLPSSMKVSKEKYDEYLIKAHNDIFKGTDRELVTSHFKKLTGVTMTEEPWTLYSQEGLRDTGQIMW